MALSACAIVVAFGAGALAATLTVNTTLDGADDNPGDGACSSAAATGSCTLRAAVQEAEALAGDDEIILPNSATPYVLTVPGRNESAGATGDLNYSNPTDNLTITGGGAATTIIDGNHLDYAVFSYSGLGNTITFNGVTIRNGGATFNGDPIGGAIGGGLGLLKLNDCIVRDSYRGFTGVNVWLTGTTITAIAGTAIEANGLVYVYRSTISGNGLGIYGYKSCGLVGCSAAYIDMRDSTVTNNINGGVEAYGAGGCGTMCQTQLGYTNTIIAGNGGTDCLTNTDALGGRAGRNLVQTYSGCPVSLGAGGDLTGVSAVLGPLQNNGGPTPTHALLAGSPAIDAIPNASCNDVVDQRGQPRPQGSGCDIGAYELGDADGDGILFNDNCPTVANPDQRNSDGLADGGDLCDPCPASNNSQCTPASSASATIGSSGGVVGAGGVTITVPPGALGGQPQCTSANCPLSFSITRMSQSEFGLGSAASGTGLYLAVKLQPEGVIFSTPVTVHFSWPDTALPLGVVDNTAISESSLRIWRNGAAITNTCGSQACGAVPCCDSQNNRWSVQVSQFSEYAVASDPCVEGTVAGPMVRLIAVDMPPGDDKLVFKGTATLPPGLTYADVDPLVHGLGFVLVEPPQDPIVAVGLPPLARDPLTKIGWKGGVYIDGSANPPAGIYRAMVKPKGRTPGIVAVTIKGRRGSFDAGAGVEARALLGGGSLCYAASFPGPPEPACAYNASGSKLMCK